MIDVRPSQRRPDLALSPYVSRMESCVRMQRSAAGGVRCLENTAPKDLIRKPDALAGARRICWEPGTGCGRRCDETDSNRDGWSLVTSRWQNDSGSWMPTLAYDAKGDKLAQLSDWRWGILPD